MKKTLFAISAAALLSAAFLTTSQAAPIAPLSGVTSTDSGQVTKVYWRHHRHCWRGRWGRLHCAW